MKLKKLLSFVLAVAMVMSLMPSYTFAASNDIASYNYSFNYKALGGSANIRINDSFWKTEYTFDNTVSSGVWKAAAIGPGNLYQLYAGGFMHWTKGSNATLGKNGMSFKLTVGKEGTFKPTLTYYEYKTGGRFNVYLVDATKTTVDSADKISEVCANAGNEEKGITLLGSFESYNASGSSSFMATYKREVSFENFPTLKLNEQDYYLVFSLDGANSAYAEGLELTDAAIAQISYQIGNLSLQEIKEPPYEYVFSAASMGQEDNKSVSEKGTGVIIRSDLNFGNVVSSLSDRWAMMPHDMTSVFMREGGIWTRVNTEQYPDWKEGGNGICLKLDVPCAGLYETKLTYDYAVNGGIADAYLIDEKTAQAKGIDFSSKEGIADAISKLSPHATFDTYNSNGTDAHMDIAGSVTLPVMSLSVGNVYLVLTLTGSNAKIPDANTLRYLELRKLNMGETTLSEVQLTLDAERILVGMDEKLNLKYINGLGKTVSVAGDTVKYTSSDESIATVSEDGTIKGLSEGTVEIQVETSIGGNTYNDSITVEVDLLIFEKAEMNLTDGEHFFVGNEKELSVSAHFDDGTTAMGAEIETVITSDNEDVAKIDGNKLIICGEGEANITAAVTFNGETKTVTRKIIAEAVKVVSIRAEIDDPIVSSFSDTGSKIRITPLRNDGTVVGDEIILPKEENYLLAGKAIGTNDENKPKFDDVAADTDKYAVNPDIASGNWIAAARLGGNLNTFYFKGYHMWSSSKTDVKLGKNGIAFKLTVDEAAEYKPELTYYENKVGGKINVYLVDSKKMTIDSSDKIEAVIENADEDGSGITLLGEFETFNEEATSSWLDSNKITGEFGNYPSLNLDAQDYYLVISLDEENSEYATTEGYAPGTRIGYYISNFVLHEVIDETPKEAVEYDCTYENLTPDIVSVSEDGYISYVSAGLGKIKVTANIEGGTYEGICEVVSSTTKTAPTIYTNKMRDTAKENAKKYSWARDIVRRTTTEADKYVENLDFIYGHFPPEGIPRSQHIALFYADEVLQWQCPACKIDILEEFGSYPWIVNPIADPWKIKCPGCQRKFPSNDFGNFYKLGIQEDGTFSRELAIEKNAELVASGHEGYLVNKLYPEMGEGWMVDAGFGWSMSEGYAGYEYKDRICPIAYYVHYLWNVNGVDRRSFLTKAIMTLRDAYLYTGDEKYGVAGAIIVDRFADVYPSYDFKKVSLCYMSNHGGARNGKAVGSASEKEMLIEWIRAVDAFYPVAGNKKVISYLSEKAKEFGLENPKLSGDNIRENWDNGVLREAYKALLNHGVYGHNGGGAQIALAAGAALDIEKETDKFVEWAESTEVLTKSSLTCPIFGVTKTSRIANAGGNLYNTFFEVIDRDGVGPAVGVSYNKGRYEYALNNGELMFNYDFNSELNILELPKLIKMYTWLPKFTLGNGYTLANGDSGAVAQTISVTDPEAFIRAFYYTGAPEIAQIYYMWMGGNIDNAYVNMFVDNEKLVNDIKKVIKEYGEYEFVSDNLAGYGLGVLRGGEAIMAPGETVNVDNRYDTWMYYGATTNSHAHLDMLQMGVDAYGFNFSPDLGYPEDATGNPRRLQWCRATISHNTVVVDGDSQDSSQGGDPLHFDDSDKVMVMDVDGSTAYNVTDIYRRTTVTVAASEKDAYTVDFFRIKGGNSHTYSFHTQSNMGYSTDDFELVPQVDENGNYIGTYASKDIERGPDPGKNPEDFSETADYETLYPRGYTYLKNVNRGEDVPSGKFSVNFKQTDFNHQLRDSGGLNLKFTAVNDWIPDSVDLMSGIPPEKASNANVPALDYMMIQRSDKNNKLDTLFTSVIQPYSGTEFIEDIVPVDIRIKSGKEVTDDEAKAIKVILKNGNTDYIVYATNNTVVYTISDNGTDIFDFSGFVGVYTLNADGANIYTYLHDGTICGELSGTAAYHGVVSDFTRKISKENFIEVRVNSDVDLSTLPGKQIVIENTKSENAAYTIKSAEIRDDKLLLGIGDVELIDGLIDYTDISKGYTYNIAKGQNFSIPLTSTLDAAPVFGDVSDGVTTSAGSSVSVKINAESPIGENIEYLGTVLPRGATLDSQTGVVTWKPSSSQIGESGFLITARDESGRTSTKSFEITVYGSTTGEGDNSSTTPSTPSEPTTPSTPSKPTEPTTPSTPSGGGGGSSGGGGGGGGATPAPSTPSDDKEEDKEDVTTPTTPSVETSERFIDLGAHDWAKDAITALADEGIIKGTSEKTFAPSANITRADFAILLVRAFKLESENEENFSDVSASDYFAKELAVARNTGLSNGIGNNKFAPRNNITRQDMMVIVYRALVAMEKEFDTAAISAPDFANVADYAKDAVASLVNAGLVNGKNGLVDPMANTTRAEVAVLVKRILDYIK